MTFNLKIISLNVCDTVDGSQFPDLNREKYDELRGLRIKENILKYDADIILLQEYSTDYCKLSDLLENYKNTLFTETYGSNCIFYKKILDKQIKIKSRDCICVNGTYIYSYRGMAGGGDSINFRIQDINRFIDLAKNNKSVMFVGDTNARQNDFNKTELSKYYNDSWEIYGTKENKYTVNGFENPFFPGGFQYTSRYDRAYYTKNIKCNHFSIIYNEHYEELKDHNKSSGCISDHYGIYCKFSLPTLINEESEEESGNTI